MGATPFAIERRKANAGILRCAENDNHPRLREEAVNYFVDTLTSENIYGSGGEQRHRHERNQGLHHHQDLGPSREDGRVCR